MRVDHDDPRPDRDRTGTEPPGPVAVEEDTGTDDKTAADDKAAADDKTAADDEAAPDDEAALADVDGGEFPPEGAEAPAASGRGSAEDLPAPGHAEEDAWLRAESRPADEVTVGAAAAGEPAVGVASVPPPGSLPPSDAAPGPGSTSGPAAFPAGDGAGARAEAAIRDAAAAREAAAERDEAESKQAEREKAEPEKAERDEAAGREGAAEREATAEGEPDRPSEADLMTAAASGDGRTAEETAPELEPEELAPGEVPVTTGAALWEVEVVDGFRDRWQQLQLRFIDDPRQAAEQARVLVGDACRGLTDALTRQRNELDRWQAAQVDDTEELRVTVRRYRDLLDRLLGL